MPHRKRAKFSNTLIMPNDTTPTETKVIPTYSLSTFNQSSVINEINNNDSEIDYCLENTEMPALQVISDSMLENPEFQEVLVQNINRLLQSPDVFGQQNQIGSTADMHEIDTIVENIGVTEQDPQYDSLLNELFLNSPKDNRKQILHSSTPTEANKSTESDSISIKQRLRKPKQPAVKQSKPTRTLSKKNKSSKLSKTTKKSVRNRDLYNIIGQPKKATEKHFDVPATVSDVFVDTNNCMKTVQSQLFDITLSTSTGNYFVVDTANGSCKILESLQSVVLNNGVNTFHQLLEPGSFINLNECDVNKQTVQQSCAAEVVDEATEAAKDEHIGTPKVSAQLRNLNMPFPGSSLNRVLDFKDEFPDKIYAVSLQQTFGMNCKISKRSIPSLDDYSDPEAEPSTATQLNEAIMSQESQEIIDLTRDNKGTVVLEISTPDRQTRQRKSKHSAIATNRKQAKKSNRTQSTTARLISTVKTNDNEKALQEWTNLPSIKPVERENCFRAQISNANKGLRTYRSAPKKQITKNASVLQVTTDTDSMDPSIQNISLDSTLTETHFQLAADILAKENPAETDPSNDVIAVA